MERPDPLRLPLAIVGLYLLAIGLVRLSPAAAEAVFSRQVIDPAMESLYGTALLALGALSAALASDRTRSRRLVWVALGGILLTTINLFRYWLVGEFDASTLLIIAINVVFTLWILVGLLRAGSSPASTEGRYPTPP